MFLNEQTNIKENFAEKKYEIVIILKVLISFEMWNCDILLCNQIFLFESKLCQFTANSQLKMSFNPVLMNDHYIPFLVHIVLLSRFFYFKSQKSRKVDTKTQIQELCRDILDFFSFSASNMNIILLNSPPTVSEQI